MKKWNHKTKKYENFKSPAKNMDKTDYQIKLLNKLTKSILKDLDKKHIAYIIKRMNEEEEDTFLWVLLVHTLMKKMRE